MNRPSDRREAAPLSGAASALDPVSRATEVLFGLIMVMTFTVSFNAIDATSKDVNLLLLGALGCNLAWGLIDGAMHLISVQADREIIVTTFRGIRDAATPEAARERIHDALPPLLRPAMNKADLERLRHYAAAIDIPDGHAGLTRGDWLAAGLIFVLVFFGTLPVVLPFMFLDDVQTALAWSHAITIASLFVTGWVLGRNWGKPWRVGLFMVGVGVALAGVALALGG